MRKVAKSGKGHRDPFRLHGVAEVSVYHGKKLVDQFTAKNIILDQGNGAIITSLASINPTQPYVVSRMAIGDQGTIPSDSTVPKVPTSNLTSLYHETYREDIEQVTITINPGTAFSLPTVINPGNTIITVADTTDVANGMAVEGTYFPAGCQVQNVSNGTQIIVSAAPTGFTGPLTENVTFSGAANQAKFVTTFNATDVPLTAFSDPSNPVVNEVGLVLINPLANGGTTRAPVAAPNANQSDEIVMSLRTFKSIPFQVANDVSITIRYTIFTV